jgi:tRNA/tmRNA/rRNA uracil-C5-methylase (TrmA/RlmC/RlmD family)
VCFVYFVVKRHKKFNDHPFPYHAEIELEIVTLTNLGLGLGRVPLAAARGQNTDGGQSEADLPRRSSAERSEGGWVVMVPFTLPGEKVRVRVYRNHKNYSEADLLEVLMPSPHRAEPRCTLFGRCGGCQYQHLNYAEQLGWKRRQVGELLQHMAGVEFPVAEVIASPREYGYRSKITPHFAAGRANPPDEPRIDGSSGGLALPPIGFLKQGSRFELIDVPQCPIATPEINAKLSEVRAETQRKLAAGEYQRGATLLLRHAQEGVVTDYDAVIHEHVGGLKLHFLARDFFQNNPFILPAFTGYVRAQAAASGAKFLIDAYCGSGLFALSCAPAFARAVGIEISETSVRFATENAAANGITNASFRAGDAAQIFSGVEFPSRETVVVIDPPRRGCDGSFLSQLFAFGPRAVVYVSCDPATQMRDLKDFLAAGYRLSAVQPFDLFPQTRHLECVITLVKSG